MKNNKYEKKIPISYFLSTRTLTYPDTHIIFFSPFSNTRLYKLILFLSFFCLKSSNSFFFCTVLLYPLPQIIPVNIPSCTMLSLLISILHLRLFLHIILSYLPFLRSSMASSNTMFSYLPFPKSFLTSKSSYTHHVLPPPQTGGR